MCPASGDDLQPNQPEGGRACFARILLILGAALLAYVLSVGPVARLVDKGRLNEAHMETLYAPLIALGERWDLAEDLLVWYCELWRAGS